MIVGFIILFSLLQTDTPNIDLPDKAKEALNIALTVRWNVSSHDIYECNFNGDTLTDYFLKATVGKDSCAVQYYIALIGDSDGYGFYLLSATPAWMNSGGENTILHRKGETISNFDEVDENGEPEQVVLDRDAIEFVPNIGAITSTFIYKKGRFHLIITGD